MINKYLQALKNILFPLLCFFCGRKIPQGYLCDLCKSKIVFLKPPLCQLCSAPLKKKVGICKTCFKKKFPYERCISVTAYEEPMKTLIHLFKYKNYQYLNKFLSSLMINHLSEVYIDFSSYHFITSVPLHYLKLKERGYNQASLLGKILGDYFKLPFKDDILYQTALKPSQTELTLKEREENVKDIFVAKGNLEGKRIIIIDDIFTTGATITACSWALKSKGAKEVLAITLSKTM